MLLSKDGEYEGREEPLIRFLEEQEVQVRTSIRRTQDWFDKALVEPDGSAGACPGSVLDRTGTGSNAGLTKITIEGVVAKCGICIAFDSNHERTELSAFLDEFRNTHSKQ